MTTRKPSLLGELLAEFLGTAVLIALGNGVVAMVVLFGKDKPGQVIHGGYTNITLGWGLAVLMGVCVAGRVSGGHLNPAVTLTMAFFRGFPWAKVLPFLAAQVAGAFAASALVFLNYRPAFRDFDPTLEKTASVFATVPAFPDACWGYGFLDQVVGTALLLGLILAITEPRNPFTTPALQPLMIALVVVAIGVSWGGMHGYAINPARDLGPRLLTLAAGFHNTGFETPSVWLVPVAGPLLGGLLGALVYEFGVRPWVPPRPEGEGV